MTTYIKSFNGFSIQVGGKAGALKLANCSSIPTIRKQVERYVGNTEFPFLKEIQKGDHLVLLVSECQDSEPTGDYCKKFISSEGGWWKDPLEAELKSLGITWEWVTIPTQVNGELNQWGLTVAKVIQALEGIIEGNPTVLTYDSYKVTKNGDNQDGDPAVIAGVFAWLYSRD